MNGRVPTVGRNLRKLRAFGPVRKGPMPGRGIAFTIKLDSRMTRDRKGGLVYSTSHGQMCPRCRRSATECACRREAAPPPGDGIVRIRLDTKGRGGKGVTVVSGVPLPASELSALGSRLKRLCGSGGTTRDGVIEVQGDHRERLSKELAGSGWKIKTI